MKKRDKHFATEAEMCAAFIAKIGDSWTSYAETSGWDILLVRNADGFQIGIQAKLTLNAHVLTQALESSGLWDLTGPDCRALLVPEFEGVGFKTIADYIGLTVITLRKMSWGRAGETVWAISPDLPTPDYRWSEDWFEWAPSKRHELPEYVPDVPAGAPAPLQLTAWKIAALKIVAILERRGYVTRADFVHVGIDHRRWMPSGACWLIGNNGGRGPGLIAGPKLPDFKGQHPTVFGQIEADAEKWMPADLLGKAANHFRPAGGA